MKNIYIFLLGAFFSTVFSVFIWTLPVSAAGAGLVLDDALCIDNGGQCDASCWTITSQSEIGICKTSGKKCCSKSDATTKKIGEEYVKANVKDPILQEKALKAVNATNSGDVAITAITNLQYQLLEKIPGAENVGSDMKGYVENIYLVGLILVVLSAVLMLSIGGFMYLTSAGNTSALGSAKTIIWDSLIGLTIALVAWLILNVINPDLISVTLNGFSPTPVAVQPTGPAPATGTGTTGTCGGLSPQAGINCGDASQGLADLLACMKGKGVATTVSSIGDSAGFNTCKNSWSKPPCAHAQTSCHYGGGKSKTDAACQASHAADLSVRNASGVKDMSIANAITAAASACGGRVNDETNIPGVAPHIHVSDKTDCCNL